MTMEEMRLFTLVEELLSLPAETTWVEFKMNNTDGDMIGKRISALSNVARIEERPFAYVIWGVEDETHAVVGTNFEPSSQRQGNQPLDFWLAQRLKPDVAFSFKSFIYSGKRLVVLEVPAAVGGAVEFERQSYLRIGSATPKLSDHPDRQRILWASLHSHTWESESAKEYLVDDDVLSALDYSSYFDLTRQRLPDNRSGIFDKLIADGLVRKDVGSRWSITNLGAILFAKRLADFRPSMARKALRLIAYDGPGRASPVVRRFDGEKGYAEDFKDLIKYADGLIPRNEYIGKALRAEQPLYPAIALRELIANALIHQDMTVPGAGPMVEVFKDRIEVSNPGKPLVSPDRFLDFPPRSRNEALASLMRRMGFCEEQGSGIDKVLDAVEFHQLPPPDFRTAADSVVVILYAPRLFSEMTRAERVRACYQHASLKYVTAQKMTNSSLRDRLGIDPQNAAQASGVIKQALGEGLIVVDDPAHPRAGYVPFWAKT